MKWLILFLIFFLLVGADKLLTLWNLQILSNNNSNYIAAEKNVAARWCFEKFGLIGGTVLFWIVTIATLSLAYYSFSLVFNPDKVLWVIFVIYGFVIFNNIYYLIKSMGVI